MIIFAVTHILHHHQHVTKIIYLFVINVIKKVCFTICKLLKRFNSMLLYKTLFIIQIPLYSFVINPSFISNCVDSHSTTTTKYECKNFVLPRKIFDCLASEKNFDFRGSCLKAAVYFAIQLCQQFDLPIPEGLRYPSPP